MDVKQFLGHTPGPWIAVGRRVEHPRDDIPDICTTAPEAMDQDERSDAECCANARLIAAAPVLLSEVRRLQVEWRTLVDSMLEELSENLRLRELGRARPDEGITAMTERIIRERDELRAERDALAARERACPTMQEAEARALVRALQEIAASVGLGLEASQADVVESVKSLAAKLAEIERAETLIFAVQLGRGGRTLAMAPTREHAVRFAAAEDSAHIAELIVRPDLAAAPQPPAADHCEDLLHMVPARPCRCGPDGCADSQCPGRSAEPRCMSRGLLGATSGVGRECGMYIAETSRCGMPAGEHCQEQKGGAA